MTPFSPVPFILVAILTCLSQLAQVAQSKKIAIIGSGVAGMSAARKLQDEVGDEYEIVVLEADPNRYGGRIKTDSTTFEGTDDMYSLMGSNESILLARWRLLELGYTGGNYHSNIYV